MPPSASTKSPRRARSAPGERAALVAEELRFEQWLWNRRAVDGHERRGLAIRDVMNELREELFAGSCLAIDDDARVALCRPRGESERADERFGGARDSELLFRLRRRGIQRQRELRLTRESKRENARLHLAQRRLQSGAVRRGTSREKARTNRGERTSRETSDRLGLFDQRRHRFVLQSRRDATRGQRERAEPANQPCLAIARARRHGEGLRRAATRSTFRRERHQRDRHALRFDSISLREQGKRAHALHRESSGKLETIHGDVLEAAFDRFGPRAGREANLRDERTRFRDLPRGRPLADLYFLRLARGFLQGANVQQRESARGPPQEILGRRSVLLRESIRLVESRERARESARHSISRRRVVERSNRAVRRDELAALQNLFEELVRALRISNARQQQRVLGRDDSIRFAIGRACRA